jgi:hypothetical protein
MGWSEDEDDRRYLVVVNYGFRAVSWGESLMLGGVHVAMPGVWRRALAAKLSVLTNP